MRKIERLMNSAIQNEQNWSKDNTTVSTQDGVSSVRLHGNLIADIGDTWIRLFDGGYKSKTTKSRLNAILAVHGNGDKVYQKNFNWYVETNGTEVPFSNGLTLR
jgi:hypothetical protein